MRVGILHYDGIVGGDGRVVLGESHRGHVVPLHAPQCDVTEALVARHLPHPRLGLPVAEHSGEQVPHVVERVHLEPFLRFE